MITVLLCILLYRCSGQSSVDEKSSTFALRRLDLSMFSSLNQVPVLDELSHLNLKPYKGISPAVFLNSSEVDPQFEFPILEILEDLPQTFDMLEIRRGRSSIDIDKSPVFVTHDDNYDGGYISATISSFLKPSIVHDVSLKNVQKQFASKNFFSSGVGFIERLYQVQSPWFLVLSDVYFR